MEGFEWAEANLQMEEPHALQDEGVNVYFAPNIAPDELVVNLDNGLLTRFAWNEDRPHEGYFANVDSLERYCRKKGIPLSETNGQLLTHTVDTNEAGDPLRHQG